MMESLNNDGKHLWSNWNMMLYECYMTLHNFFIMVRVSIEVISQKIFIVIYYYWQFIHHSLLTSPDTDKSLIFVLVYTHSEFILVRLWRKLLADRNTLESIPGTNQYWAISVKFLAQGNNRVWTIWLAILRLLVWRVNHSTRTPHFPFWQHW